MLLQEIELANVAGEWYLQLMMYVYVPLQILSICICFIACWATVTRMFIDEIPTFFLWKALVNHKKFFLDIISNC